MPLGSEFAMLSHGLPGTVDSVLDEGQELGWWSDDIFVLYRSDHLEYHCSQ